MSLNVTEEKMECVLVKDGRALAALLHLIEVRYRDGITFWAGVASLTTDSAEAFANCSEPVFLEARLADGRKGQLYVTCSHQEPGVFELAVAGKPKGKSLADEE